MLGHPWIAPLVYARELLQARVPEWRKFPWLLALMGPGVARARYGRNAQLIQRKDTQRAIDINHDAPLAPCSGEDRNDRPGPLAVNGLDVMAALHRSFLHAWCSPMTKRCSGPDRSARLSCSGRLLRSYLRIVDCQESTLCPNALPVHQ